MTTADDGEQATTNRVESGVKSNPDAAADGMVLDTLSSALMSSVEMFLMRTGRKSPWSIASAT